MPEVSAKERKAIMESNSEKVENTTYLKPLTDEEVTAKRELLADNSIKLSDLAEKKASAMKEFKLQMDPLAIENNMLLHEIRSKQKKVDGTLYHMANHETEMMEIYDEDGYLLETRRLLPSEKQARLFIHRKVM
jgi:hypothetical protein